MPSAAPRSRTANRICAVLRSGRRPDRPSRRSARRTRSRPRNPLARHLCRNRTRSHAARSPEALVARLDAGHAARDVASHGRHFDPEPVTRPRSNSQSASGRAGPRATVVPQALLGCPPETIPESILCESRRRNDDAECSRRRRRRDSFREFAPPRGSERVRDGNLRLAAKHERDDSQTWISSSQRSPRFGSLTHRPRPPHRTMDRTVLQIPGARHREPRATRTWRRSHLRS